MRLPAITDGQKAIEQAREFHERVWGAYRMHSVGEGDGRALINVPDELREREQSRISGALKDFWTRRGFRLRTHQTEGGIQVWIEART